jgi:NAD(P)-dependent dehydrogenase (short-subunit alcohol dehydrogenase family)
VTAPAPTAPVGLAPLHDKVVLITGAGAGIGRAIAVQCARAGAAVVATGPGTNVLETATIIESAGGRVAVAHTDVSQADQVAAAVSLAVDRFGGLDGVVHNAISRHSNLPMTIGECTGAVWQDMLGVSLRGAYLCARFALPELRQRQGRLLLMTSAAAMEGNPRLPGYAAVKGALRALTKSLAVEWGPLGVSVAAVSPMAVTPALEIARRENPVLARRLQNGIPLGRVGEPDTDIAPAVVFLLSDGARYITGQTVVVDGARFTGL